MTKHATKILAWLVFSLVFVHAAQAMSLRELRTLQANEKQGKNYAAYYLIGAMEGALEANAQAVRAGAKPLFCINGRRLEPRMAQSLYDAELKRGVDVYEADMAVQLVMTNALVNVYTCV